MLNNDILLLLIGTKSGKNVLTSKVFEYLRANRPILGLLPAGGEAEELLNKLGNSWTCPLEDVEAIKLQLKAIINFVNHGGTVDFDISEFSRANQVNKFFSFIEEKL